MPLATCLDCPWVPPAGASLGEFYRHQRDAKHQGFKLDKSATFSVAWLVESDLDRIVLVEESGDEDDKGKEKKD
jgi:hypothetical protein